MQWPVSVQHVVHVTILVPIKYVCEVHAAYAAVDTTNKPNTIINFFILVILVVLNKTNPNHAYIQHTPAIGEVVCTLNQTYIASRFETMD